MNAEQQFQAICNLPNLDIEEGGSGPNVEYIDFSLKVDKLNIHGRYTLVGEDLEYSLCYQHDDEIFDLEHVNENGEKLVTVDCDKGWVCFISEGENGIDKVEIKQHHSVESGKSYCFTLNKNYPLFELS